MQDETTKIFIQVFVKSSSLNILFVDKAGLHLTTSQAAPGTILHCLLLLSSRSVFTESETKSTMSKCIAVLHHIARKKINQKFMCADGNA